MEIIKLKCKSIMIGRKPRQDNDQFKTLTISTFDEINPHKSGAAPIKTLDFRNMEKARIRHMNVSYYIEGNDLVINDLHEASLEVHTDKHKVVIRGKQDIVEERVRS